MGAMKEFHPEGPVRPDDHHLILPLERVDLDAVLAREDTARAMRALLSQLAARAEMTLADETPGRLRNAALADAGPDGALSSSTARSPGRGRRSSAGARRRSAAASRRSLSGGCEGRPPGVDRPPRPAGWRPQAVAGDPQPGSLVEA